MALADDLNKPIIAVTMGDPGGIGSEIIVKALADPELRRRGRFVIYGLNELLTYAADMAEMEVFWWRDQHERINRLSRQSVIVADYDDITWPTITERGSSRIGGEASMRFVTDAIDDAMRGNVDAIVTAPISKHSWNLAGYKFPGHTELLTERTKSRQSVMMFIGGPFRLALATIHEGLFELRHRFTIGKVFAPIDLSNQALKDYFGIEKPKIAVAALNPHAGEEGKFGDEEHRIIEPAILMAQEQGIDVKGPFPADTLFHKVLQNPDAFDMIVAMYHDQGLIPLKMLAFDKAVNVTIGLPIIRTSPDHGTAFDIVGKNIAKPDSMKAALHLACDMAIRKRAMRTIPNK